MDSDGTTGGQLTTAQVAALLGNSPERVRQLAREGRLPHHRGALGRTYDPTVVRAFAQGRRTPTASTEGTDHE